VLETPSEMRRRVGVGYRLASQWTGLGGPPPDSISSALICMYVCALIGVLLWSIGHDDSSIVGHLRSLAAVVLTIQYSKRVFTVEF
jgi:hypothetical protein